MIGRSYEELMEISDYNGRLEYLKLLDENAKSPRHISGDFYRSPVWKEIRKRVIERDCRFDLGIFGVYIEGPVYVHHINPIDEDDIANFSNRLISLSNLVCTSLDSHNAIHYKSETDTYVERTSGDTRPW